MLYSEVLDRKVVATSTAATVGIVHSLVIDPGSSRVVALSLSKTPGSATMLPWQSINALGADAVTVADDSVLVSDERLSEMDSKPHAILKKRVLTTEGYEVGSVNDVDFDPSDGRIDSLVLDNYRWKGDLLVGIGSYAVMVRPQDLHPPGDLNQSSGGLGR